MMFKIIFEKYKIDNQIFAILFYMVQIKLLLFLNQLFYVIFILVVDFFIKNVLVMF